MFRVFRDYLARSSTPPFRDVFPNHHLFSQIFFPRTLEDSKEEQQQQQLLQATTVSGKFMEDSFTFTTQPFTEDVMTMYDADKVPVDVRPESDSGFSSFRFSRPPSPPPQRPPRPEGGEVEEGSARRAYPPLKPSRRDVESLGVDEMATRSRLGAPPARQEQVSSENLHPYVSCAPLLFFGLDFCG
jgi:hypothetical protein